MHAAVVTAFGKPPRFEPFPTPEPRADEFLVEVLAVGLHPRVRSGASGTHYTSTGTLPMVPGIDGVARRDDGTVIYFASDDDVIGTMAERAAVDPRRCIELPTHVNVATIAAAMNPAMSSWVALRRRVPLRPGQIVVVLGATGNAGTMAVQVAKHLGAGDVVAVGRNPDRLRALSGLGADRLVTLTGDNEVDRGELAAAAADADVVLDYLWGEPTERAIAALLTARSERSRELNWIQIGAVAGPTISLPSVALRSANLRLQGNGQGAVSPAAYVAELPSLVVAISDGVLAITVDTEPLSEVEWVWTRPDIPGRRTVLVP